MSQTGEEIEISRDELERIYKGDGGIGRHIQGAALSCRTGGNLGHAVVLQFKTLEEAHALHRALVGLRDNCILPAVGLEGGKFYFWKFVHNAVIHPLLAFPWKGPKWLLKARDWTAGKCSCAS